MELKKAIAAALRFCAKGEGPLGGVRLLPSGDNQRSRLYAYNDRCGVIVEVDEDLPNMWVASEKLRAIGKGKGEVTITPGAHGAATFSGVGFSYDVHCAIDLKEFPGLPLLPDAFMYLDMDPILQVVHAASEDEDYPSRQTLHFTDEWVEAFDGSRLARVYTRTGVAGLLPSEMFKSWPKRQEAGVFTSKSGVYFKIGEDEIRFAPYVIGEYPDMAQVIPDSPRGCTLVVGSESLATVVKRATDVSLAPTINLSAMPGKLVVTAWEEATQRTFKAEVEAIGNCEGVRMLNGRNLEQTLKVVSTPNVMVRFTPNQLAPIQIESAGYVEVLWPMGE